jgi:integrase
MTRRSDFELSANDRYEARRAKQLLEGSGLSLSDAARLALEAAGKRPSNATSIEVAIDGFQKRGLEKKLREATFDFYEKKLGQFSDAFPGETLDAVTRPRIRAWIDGLPVAPSTRKGSLRAIHALYAWARSKEPPLCAANSCEGLRVEEAIDDREPVTLQAPELAAMLEAAGPFRAAVALMAFAGIRPEEMAGQRKERLDWRHVDRKAKAIRIPGDIAKTRTPRILEKLPPCLWAWLKGAPEAGPIAPGRAKQWIRVCLPPLLAARPDLKAWPHDVLRHTAASFLLALWGDAGRVSMVLGHEGKPALLFSRYRATMTKAQAKAIAEIKPSGHA